MNPILLATSTNINLDTQSLQQCLKEVWHFGYTDFVNICTAQTNAVSWGGLDWIVVLGCILVFGGIGITGLALVIRLVLDL